MKNSVLMWVGLSFFIGNPILRAEPTKFSLKRALLTAIMGTLSKANPLTPEAPSGKLILSPRQIYAPKHIQLTEVNPPDTSNGINYNGGPVLENTTLYHLYYGSWNQSQISIVEDFSKSLNKSPYYGIVKTYGDTRISSIPDSVHFNGSTSVGFTKGTLLQDTDIAELINNATTSGKLPTDTQGIYFVLTSESVTMDGLCSAFCGYHSFYYPPSGDPIKIAFIPNTATQCPRNCIENPESTPNGDPGVDGAINVYAHELMETVTDPEITAWYNPINDTAYENADLCAWKFGNSTYPAANGAWANVHLGDRDYRVQTIWLNTQGGFCGLALPSTSGSPSQSPSIATGSLIQSASQSSTPSRHSSGALDSKRVPLLVFIFLVLLPAQQLLQP